MSHFERFPIPCQPFSRRLLYLSECSWSSEEDHRCLVEAWIHTQAGEDFQTELLERFKSVSEPRQLALNLAGMYALKDSLTDPVADIFNRLWLLPQWNCEAFERAPINALISCFEFATYELDRDDSVLTFLHRELIHIEAKIRTTELCKYMKGRLAGNTHEAVMEEIFVEGLYSRLEKACTLEDA